MIKKISIISCICITTLCIGVMLGKYLYEQAKPREYDIPVIGEDIEISIEEDKKASSSPKIIVEDMYADEIEPPKKDQQMTPSDYSNFETIIDDLIEATE